MKEDYVVTYILQINNLVSKINEMLPSDIKQSDEYEAFSTHFILFREYIFKYIREHNSNLE